VSGTPELGPQAQSVEAYARCLGPISGSMHNPAVEDHEAVVAWPVLTQCACSTTLGNVENTFFTFLTCGKQKK
jgi:hypothetical protein